MTDTNAGPVLPAMPGTNTVFVNEKPWRVIIAENAAAWGRQCWDAAVEQVAGPLRDRLEETERALALSGMETEGLRQRIAELERELEESTSMLDNAVSKSPAPLRELGEYIGSLTDEDQWPETERYLNATAIACYLLRAENEALRELLCSAHAGALAYRDDGEMQDNTAHPCIDFKRDTPEQILAALRRRSEAARAAREGK